MTGGNAGENDPPPEKSHLETVVTAESPAEVYRALVEVVHATLDPDHAAVALHGDAALEVVESWARRPEFEVVRYSSEMSHPGMTVSSQKSCLLHDVTDTRGASAAVDTGDDICSGDEIRSRLCVPLKDAGVIVAEATVPEAFTDADVERIETIADAAIGALARLNNESLVSEAVERRCKALFNQRDVMAAFLDPDGRVRRINEVGRGFMESDPESVIGTRFWEAPWMERSSDDPEKLRSRLERVREGEVVSHESVYRARGSERIVDVTYQPVTDEDGDLETILVTARDVTEQKKREAELERQNRRLDDFTQVVSHDLRNPIQVADGRLELAREECDSSHLDEVARAHERMKELIEDLLTLAREGKSTEGIDSVDLEAMLNRCWQNVPTEDASLLVRSERSIRGDRGRLRQLFENLFRNAVEHGGSSVSVTVGDLEDGFYVEDDGPGIPEDERGRVFEAGYSSARGGNGLGLSIVKRIASEHDWRVSVVEGEDGGARFEFTGVDGE